MSQTKQWSVNLSTAVRKRRSNGATEGSGKNSRLYVGYYSGYDYDSFIRFALDWTNVGKIVKAELTLYTDDGLGIMDSTTTEHPYILFRRLTDAFDEGSNSTGFTSSDYTSAAGTSSHQRSVYVSRAVFGLNTIDITDIVEDWAPKTVKKRNGQPGSAASNYGIGLFGSSDSAKNWAGFSDDYSDSTYWPVITLTYEFGPTVPNTPTNLAPVGSVASFTDFQGDFSDPRTTDELRKSHVQVFDAGHAFTVATTDVITSTGHGLQNGDIIYLTALTNGDGLSTFTKYYVVSRTTTTFKVSATLNGTPVNVTATGSGTWSKMIYDYVKTASATEVQSDHFTHVPNVTLLANTTYRWRVRLYDQEGQVSPFTSLTSFSFSNTAPNAPTLTPSGASYSTLDGVLFRGTFTDPNVGDTMLAYQVQMSAYPSGDVHWDDDTYILWNTGKVYPPSGQTSFSTPYGGASLAAGIYYWRARVWDSKQSYSAWAYATITVTADFVPDPADTPTSIQLRPRAPWRIVIKEMAFNAQGGALTGVASTGVFTTASAHGLTALEPVRFSALTGPSAGLLVGTTYYVKTVPSSTTFTVSASQGGATLTWTGNVTAGTMTHVTTRGPGNIVAVIEDAKNVGASILYNSPGELHFTLGKHHPQLSVIEAKQTHYSVQFRSGDGWREVFAGLMWDFDASDTDIVFYGIDYLALLDYTLDERYDASNPDLPAEKGGSKYVTTGKNSIQYIVTDQLNIARGLANSPVGFITVGAIATMTETLSVFSTYSPTLSFITGLLDSHRAGQGKKTRLSVRPKTGGGYEFVVQDDPGQVRDNLRLRYGELVQGYRVVPFGTAWASRISAIGRAKDGIAVLYKTATAPGINEAVWGRFTQVRLIDGVSDANDLTRRTRQAAIHAGKLGKSIALGIRTGMLQPRDGYDICDMFPVDIVDGSVNTANFGSGYWVAVGITWQAAAQTGKQEVNLTFQPREDGTPPSSDLLTLQPISGQAYWQVGWEPPTVTSRDQVYISLDTGHLMDADEAMDQLEYVRPVYHMDTTTGIVYVQDAAGNWSPITAPPAPQAPATVLVTSRSTLNQDGTAVANISVTVA